MSPSNCGKGARRSTSCRHAPYAANAAPVVTTHPHSGASIQSGSPASPAAIGRVNFGAEAVGFIAF
ncbi:hypothetical protein EON82_14485 [bacterium]|nr:MAG: hypothetical protein EON82_14485 [bacterium]